MSTPKITLLIASAGSGKTFSIAKEYVRLLLNNFKESGPRYYKSILAVTFANKASFEMKSRIIEFLKILEFGNEEQKEAILENLKTNDFDVDITLAARKILDEILDDYSNFQIKTIDSFFKDIIFSFSYNLGLKPNLEIVEEINPYLELAIDELIYEASNNNDLKNLFLNYLDRMLNVENRITWYPKLAVLGALDAIYKIQKTHGGHFVLSGVSNQKIIEKRKEFIHLLNTLKDKLPKNTNANFTKSIDKILAQAENFSISNLSTFFKRSSFPINQKSKTPKEVEKIWKKLLIVLKEICYLETYSKFDPYIEIFNKTIERTKNFAIQENVFFITDFNDCVFDIISGKTDVQIEEIFIRLSSNIKHFLIDEFQDSNDLQWENFKPMVTEALSQGGSLFIVGDKKQSIYRFRGSNPFLFDKVKDDFNIDKTKDFSQQYLSVNRRSAKQIVELVNEVFSIDNLKKFVENLSETQRKYLLEEQVYHLFENAKQSTFHTDYNGFVYVEHIQDDTENEFEESSENDNITILDTVREKTINFVKRLSSYDKLSNICILCRTNKDVQEFSSWLIEENVPVASSRTLLVTENPLIKEILSVLKFFTSLIDDLSFASFITGDIFLKATGLEKRKIEKFIFQSRAINSNGEKPVYLYQHFKKEYKPIWEDYFLELSRIVGFIPLYEFLIKIFNKFEVLKNFSWDLAYFLKLLDIVKENESEINSISDLFKIFEKENEALFVNASESDGIKVMTIHQAKGLQFNSVILPFLYHNVKLSELSKNKYILKKNNDKLQMINASKDYLDYLDELKIMYQEEYTKQFCDELNLIYVALTRAIFNLVVFIPSKFSNNRKNCVSQLLAPIENGTLYDRSINIKSEIENKKTLSLFVQKINDPTDFIKSDSFSHDLLLNREKITLGQLTHFILSLIKDYKSVDFDKIIDIARTVYPFENISDAVDCVKRLLSNEKIKQFFEPNLKVFTEKEIVSQTGQTFRIDRLILKDNEVLIVDFKSSQENTIDHFDQMNNYKFLVSKIYKDKSIRGFLIYFDSCKIEEVL